jgi:hypothetical protein
MAEAAPAEPIAVEAAVAEAAPPASDGSAAEPQVFDLDAEYDPDNFLFDDEAVSAAADTAEAAPNGHAAEPATDKSPEPPRPAPPADPLIPIKAMTPEERIALFS